MLVVPDHCLRLSEGPLLSVVVGETKTAVVPALWALQRARNGSCGVAPGNSSDNGSCSGSEGTTKYLLGKKVAKRCETCRRLPRKALSLLLAGSAIWLASTGVLLATRHAPRVTADLTVAIGNSSLAPYLFDATCLLREGGSELLGEVGLFCEQWLDDELRIESIVGAAFSNYALLMVTMLASIPLPTSPWRRVLWGLWVVSAALQLLLAYSKSTPPPTLWSRMC